MYSYHQYPIIDTSLIGPMRQRIQLIDNPEIKRLQSSYLNLNILTTIHSRLSNNSSNNVNNNNQKEMIDMEEWLIDNYARLKRIEHVISNFQVSYLYLKSFRLQRKRLNYCIMIQNWYRRMKAKQLLVIKRQLKQLEHAKYFIVKLQSWMRCKLIRRQYHHQIQQIVKLQGWFRQISAKQRYLRTKQVVIRIQSYLRGNVQRMKSRQALADKIQSYLNQIVLLWLVEHSPLYHRTSFYLHISQIIPRANCYMKLSLCQDELLRLYQSLQLPNLLHLSVSASTASHSSSSSTADVFSTRGCHGLSNNQFFQTYFESVQASEFMQLISQYYSQLPLTRLIQLSTAAGNNSSSTSSSNPAVILPCLMKFFVSNLSMKKRIEMFFEREMIERKELYLSLKVMADNEKVKLFQSFQLASLKKRKTTLSWIIWNSVESSHIEASLMTMECLRVTTLPVSISAAGSKGRHSSIRESIVSHVYQPWTTTQLDLTLTYIDYVELRRQALIVRALSETASASLKSLSDLKRAQRQLIELEAAKKKRRSKLKGDS